MPYLVRLLLSLAPALICAAPAAADDWQRIELIDEPEIRVSLIILPNASPALDRFIGFELENRTGKPMRLQNGRFRFNDLRLSDGGVGGGGSGNVYDLLHRDGGPPPGPEDRDVLPPGITSYTRSTSIRTTALIAGRVGLLPDRDEHVTATVEISLTLDNATTYTTPGDGIAFHFRWLRPDENSIDALRRQLLRTLAEPSEWTGDNVRLQYLLAEESVASAASLEDLLSALKRHDQSPRRPIGDYINAHHALDERVIDFWLQCIADRDHLLVAELARASNTRDLRLIEPLVSWVESKDDHTHGWEHALRVLARHRDLMPDRDKTIARLGQVARRRLLVVGKPDREDVVVDYIGLDYERLVLAGDPTSLPLLVPYLDRKEILINVRDLAVRGNAEVSQRLCDAAYNAILDLLELPGERFVFDRPADVPDAEAEHARRDAAIDRLKQMLRATP